MEILFVILINMFIVNKLGFVGWLLLGMMVCFEEVFGVDKGGCFFVFGLNIMMGYLKVDLLGVV